MSLALVIATADRPGPLAATLAGLTACEVPGEVLEVVVADNGTDPAVAQVCARDWPGLAVRHLGISRRGKTIAQNAAVEATDAELLVFTDDDVEFDARWLGELHRASLAWPDHHLFGGRVVPLWPDGIPNRLQNSDYVGPLYTLLDRGGEERPIPGFRPFGPNMAVRRSLFAEGLRFDEVIGPGSSQGVSMGDETGIARELETRGEVAVYVPGSVVYHRVRPEQLSLSWQLKRGMRYGRMIEYYAARARRATAGSDGTVRVLGVPRWLIRRGAGNLLAAGVQSLLGRHHLAFDHLMAASVALGQLQQDRRRRAESDPEETAGKGP